MELRLRDVQQISNVVFCNFENLLWKIIIKRKIFSFPICKNFISFVRSDVCLRMQQMVIDNLKENCNKQ